MVLSPFRPFLLVSKLKEKSGRRKVHVSGNEVSTAELILCYVPTVLVRHMHELGDTRV